MCELEYGCEFKPVSLMERRNSLGFNKPCATNPDMCGHFREVRREKRLHAAYSDGQMNLNFHFVFPVRT